MDEQIPRIEELYWTPTLPRHWIAKDEHGAYWRFPDTPLGPEAWAKRKPYKGPTAGLQLAVPQRIALFYDPQGGELFDSQREVGEAMLTVGEAAQRAHVDRATVDRAIKRGDLQVTAMRGTRRMLKAADVAAWTKPRPVMG